MGEYGRSTVGGKMGEKREGAKQQVKLIPSQMDSKVELRESLILGMLLFSRKPVVAANSAPSLENFNFSRPKLKHSVTSVEGTLGTMRDSQFKANSSVVM